jgi:hypothetical protein
MSDAFILFHTRKTDETFSDIKIIGVFSSENAAQQAELELRTKPGFERFPDGFTIDRYTIDQSHWTEGFVA